MSDARSITRGNRTPDRPVGVGVSQILRHRSRVATAVLLGATLVATACTETAVSDSAAPAVSELPGSSSVARGEEGAVSPLRTAPPSTVTGTPGIRLASLTSNADAPINDVAVDADRRVATAGSDGVVVVHDLSSSSPTSVPLGHPEGQVDAVAFDPRGGRLATGIAERRAATAFDDTVSVWDVADAERLIHVGGEADAIAGCSFFRNIVDWAHDGTFVTSTSHDFTVSLIDPDNGRTLHTFAPHANTVLDTAISPDDRLLVTSGDDSTMRVWDLQSKDLIAEHEVTMGGYWSMAFLPDGNSLVVSDIIGSISVVDVVSGETTMTFDGRKLRRASIAVSPDGRLVAAGGDDSVVRLWSTETGKMLGDLVGHTGPVKAVVFFDDGQRLVSGSYDGTAIVWRYATT